MNKSFTFLCFAIITVFSIVCDTDENTHSPPSAYAGNDTIVMPDSLIVLRAQVSDPDNDIQSVEWLVAGVDTFSVIANTDTTIAAPSSFSSRFPIILAVSDNNGYVVHDTMNVIVSWIIKPNGGEVFYVGDTMRVDLFRFYDLCSMKLMIDRDGDLLSLNVPGLNNMFVPNDVPSISFAIPDSIYDQAYGWVNMATDSCRVRVLRYMDPNYFIESASYFTIRPRQ